MTNISEEKVIQEAEDEFKKNWKELVKDVIREANTHPTAPEGKDENLDLIKHLIKRLAIHQVCLEHKTEATNLWLLVLSIVMAIGAFFTILQYFKN